MIGAIVASPATWFLALLVGVSAVLPRLGRRAWRMGPMALTAVVMYVVSTAIVTSYHYVPGDVQVSWWTTSLLIVGLIYSGILTVRIGQFGLLGAIYCVALFFAATFTSDTITMRWAWFFQFAGIAALAFLSYLTVNRRDVIGQLTWATLFVAEGISAAQVVDCQLLHGMSNQPISEGSACAQVYHWAGAAYLPTSLTAIILIWILYRWLRIK